MNMSGIQFMVYVCFSKYLSSIYKELHVYLEVNVHICGKFITVIIRSGMIQFLSNLKIFWL